MVFAKHVEKRLPAVEDDGLIGHFDIHALSSRMPDASGSIIADHCLVRRNIASARIIKTLQAVPPHVHQSCDEYIFILRGSGIVWLEDPLHQAPFHAGHLIFVAAGVIRCMPHLVDGPVLSFSVDTPNRLIDDIIYVDR